MSLRRVFAIVVVGAAMVVTLASPASAQPDFKKAAEHYKNAEAAMAAEKWDSAASEYGIAYEITRDPVLFFKIAGAADKGGKCPLAITYYRRYLKEASPNEEFRKKTTERIVACGGKLDPVAGSSDPGTGSGSAVAVGTGSGAGSDVGAGSGSAVGAGSGAGSDVGAGSGSAAGSGAGSGSGSDSGFSEDSTITLAPTLVDEKPSSKKTGAWIAVGTSIAAVTVGSVLLMSASSTEKDIQDLYANTSTGRPPMFEGTTKTRYDELVSQGKRFNTLAAISFGAAGAAAAIGVTLFVMDRGHGTSSEKAHALRVVPTVGPSGAGFAALGHF
ncbi:MAG: hypothetical protein K8W52_39580 [Deltaproteobacteria bacterium]|nr:hypothetical protein [Deltaproteobacteria bacterium]